MDIDVASALNCLTAREKAVLVAFLRLSEGESGKIMAGSRQAAPGAEGPPRGGLSPGSN